MSFIVHVIIGIWKHWSGQKTCSFRDNDKAHIHTGIMTSNINISFTPNQQYRSYCPECFVTSPCNDGLNIFVIFRKLIIYGTNWNLTGDTKPFVHDTRPAASLSGTCYTLSPQIGHRHLEPPLTERPPDTSANHMSSVMLLKFT